jgi:hypothetical protein
MSMCPLESKRSLRRWRRAKFFCLLGFRLVLIRPLFAQCYSCPPYPNPSPWVYDLDPSGRTVWAGVDHPYYQPTIPFREPHSPERVLKRFLERGDRAHRRGAVEEARRLYREVEERATRAWGAESRQAREARGRWQAMNLQEVFPAGTRESLLRTLRIVKQRLQRARRFSHRKEQ